MKLFSLPSFVGLSSFCAESAVLSILSLLSIRNSMNQINILATVTVLYLVGLQEFAHTLLPLHPHQSLLVSVLPAAAY